MSKTRKYLSADGLLNVIRRCIAREKIKELPRSEYSWHDCIMSGLAIFGFKLPSLLQFDQQSSSVPMIRRNLRSLYGVKKAPSDTCLRERLDQLSPQKLRRSFKSIFAHLQRGKALEAFKYLGGHYIISVDGTGQYSSKEVHCKNCCEKSHGDSSKTYYHHMLGASLVHPELKTVIPLAPEPITKRDGATKNDCERNASKRLLSDLRREHPHLKILIVEDGLASNFPHLSLLDSLKMSYIIGAKSGDHQFMFNWIRDLRGEAHTQETEDGSKHDFHFYADVPLSDSHFDYRVNVVEYCETKKSGKKTRFSWVTNLTITPENVYEVMRAARARWRIENETFNTLKNQGYNFGHNYGHGYENLCSVMTMLMMLAFLIDQVQQLCCKVYQNARSRLRVFKMLFDRAQVLIELYEWPNLESLYAFIGAPPRGAPPADAEGVVII